MSTASKVVISVVSASLAVVVLGLLLWGWIAGMHTDWWASAGQWTGGLGSIAAAGAAIWIAISGWSRSERQRKDDQERELAGRFGIWVRRSGGGDAEVLYVNAGPLPIYDVVAQPVVDGEPVDFRLDLASLGPTQEPTLLPDLTSVIPRFVSERLRVEFDGPGVDDGDLSAVDETLSGLLEHMSGRLAVINSASVRVTFRDANGLRWVREADGRLARLVSQES
ncbi:hypothetical protein [Amycolatopsis sp. NPDC004625]|uniref:hypothetical protein n=1 Tax=Amycolatopsis sp. NPDC004625 TaxID=3154670 RepID=UPI0033AC450E